MTKEKRLELYEKAIVDYKRRAKRNDIFRFDSIYDYGFCEYFESQHFILLSDLPELYNPTSGILEYYWDYRKKQPRIKALKKAIKTLKDV